MVKGYYFRNVKGHYFECLRSEKVIFLWYNYLSLIDIYFRLQVSRSNLDQHYLEDSHQQCLTMITKILWSQLLGLASQKQVHEHERRVLTDCLRKIGESHEAIDTVYQDYVQIDAKKQLMSAKVAEIRNNLKKLEKDLSITAESIESIYGVFIDLKRVIDEMNAMLVTGSKLIDENDTYLWKINRILLLAEDSLPIHSDRFQTSKWGYKLGVSLDTYTAESNGPHCATLSFTIYRGDYDGILEWPFPYQVTIYLLDVTKNGKHIVHSIQPDSRKEIFGRPLADANVPYAISGFCAIKDISRNPSPYVSEDNVFIRVHIDFFKTDAKSFYFIAHWYGIAHSSRVRQNTVLMSSMLGLLYYTISISVEMMSIRNQW